MPEKKYNLTLVSTNGTRSDDTDFGSFASMREVYIALYGHVVEYLESNPDMDDEEAMDTLREMQDHFVIKTL
jgi:hypothetical protein